MATKLLSILASTLAFTGLFASSAQAFTFTTNYTTSLTGNKQWRGNIFLNSVKIDSTGKTYSDFALVSEVNILENDVWTGGSNSGGASADRGDLATGVKQEDLPVGFSPIAAAALGNLNLNNIIDGEDKGKYKMNLFFNKAVDTLFFWERGRNSLPIIQALDAAGNLIGNAVTLGSAANPWKLAEFSLDTTEVGLQEVGSRGISLTDLFGSDTSVKSIAGIQVTSSVNRWFSSNGPDFKVVGASVPEPTTVLGLGLVGGALVMSRRKKA